MPIVTITRSDEYLNRARAIKIVIDGKEAGSLSNAATQAFELPAGTHILQAKIDWCNSNTLSLVLRDNETKTVALSSFSKMKRPGGFTILYCLIFTPGKYLQLAENQIVSYH